MKKVKSAIGRDELDDGVCVFEKVMDYKITSPQLVTKYNLKSTLYNLLPSSRKKISSRSDSDTKDISCRQTKYVFILLPHNVYVTLN